MNWITKLHNLYFGITKVVPESGLLLLHKDSTCDILGLDELEYKNLGTHVAMFNMITKHSIIIVYDEVSFRIFKAPGLTKEEASELYDLRLLPKYMKRYAKYCIGHEFFQLDIGG